MHTHITHTPVHVTSFLRVEMAAMFVSVSTCKAIPVTFVMILCLISDGYLVPYSQQPGLFNGSFDTDKQRFTKAKKTSLMDRHWYMLVQD